MGLEQLDSLLMNWMVNTFIILAINNATQRNKILHFVRVLLGKKTKLLKSWLCGCLPCMATSWGSLYYLIRCDQFIVEEYFIYIISLSGFIVLFEKIYGVIISKNF